VEARGEGGRSGGGGCETEEEEAQRETQEGEAQLGAFSTTFNFISKYE